MDLGIEGKVALVAAASKGFGRAIAAGLSAEGARVAICARGAEALHEAAAEIHARTGGEVLPVVADVTTAAGCHDFVEAARQRWGTVEILVANSGGPAPGTFDQLDDAAWEAAVQSTLMNVVRLVRLAVPHMRAAGWGRIVNVQSISVRQPIDTLLLSNSIRPATLGLLKTLATQLAPNGILLNSVLPGSHATDRLNELAAVRAQTSGRSAVEELREMAASIPLGRLGRPEELADVVVFLCSERASFVTGTSLLVDGGACRAVT